MEQMGTEKKQQVSLWYMEQMGYDPITFQLANPMAHLSMFHASTDRGGAPATSCAEAEGAMKRNSWWIKPTNMGIS